jgi:mitochondrial distribution and morphology protein 31
MNAGVTGPFGWITSGTVDVDFRFLVPQSSDSHIMEIIRDEMEDIKEVALDKLDVILKTPEHPTKAVQNPIRSIPPLPDYTIPSEAINSNIKPKQYPNINPSLSISIPQLPLNTVFFQCDVTINNLRAFVPLSSPHLTYMSNALIRPVVGYLNSHRTKIPLSFAATMSLVRPKRSSFSLSEYGTNLLNFVYYSLILMDHGLLIAQVSLTYLGRRLGKP